MRPVVAVACIILGTTGCATAISFASVPIAIRLPSGPVLKGGITVRFGKGYFQASNGSLTCSGEARRTAEGFEISGPCTGSNAPVKRIQGSASERQDGSGEGTIVLPNAGSAVLLYGKTAEGTEPR
jgi:hypothetical protein